MFIVQGETREQREGGSLLEFIFSIRDAIVEICEQWQSGNFKDSGDVLADIRYHNVRNMLHNDWSFQASGGASC